MQHHQDVTPRTWHALSNILIDIESATTTRSVSYFTVHQELPGLPLQPIVTGRYVDTFERRDGKWRYASRWVQPASSVMSASMSPPRNAEALIGRTAQQSTSSANTAGSRGECNEL
ncbi:aromatic-ring-hydroxylating dioxygenase beta subunit [Sinorhizobium meliloti CCNWSX0020]|uniref:Aromatic-ring-hydroxylating dioxygenase beta subunit n=1 Tax=Sinorhizobium meliloti CCNWSX0020 TaxID=1107881 RepID=H0FYD5_RHIML|nr:aromatic-ring-hydroxylating dioxygenase beta subunit [Sinorhizobium meliloti CCNWSX0020]